MVNKSHKMLYPVQERLNLHLSGWLFAFHTTFNHESVSNGQPLFLSQAVAMTWSILAPWAKPTLAPANPRHQAAS